MAPELIRSLAVEEIVLKPTANHTANVSITNIAPAAVSTATISGWVRIVIDGADAYVPYWQ